MNLIAAALADEERHNTQCDPMLGVVKTIAASDFPDDTKAALVKHVNDARTKHPYRPKVYAGDMSPAIAETRPSPMSKVAALIADGANAKPKTQES